MHNPYWGPVRDLCEEARPPSDPVVTLTGRPFPMSCLPQGPLCAPVHPLSRERTDQRTLSCSGGTRTFTTPGPRGPGPGTWRGPNDSLELFRDDGKDRQDPPLPSGTLIRPRVPKIHGSPEAGDLPSSRGPWGLGHPTRTVFARRRRALDDGTLRTQDRLGYPFRPDRR